MIDDSNDEDGCCCCCRHEKLRCRYSDIAEGEPGNHCIFAHSIDELDEWKSRYQWRQMKKQMAKDRQLYSYMDTLVDDIAAAAATPSLSPVVCLLSHVDLILHLVVSR